MKKEQHRTVALRVRRTAKCGYLLYLPAGYDRRAAGGFPLILFLHGAGERGANMKLVSIHGIPRRIENGDEFPFVVVAPQCPAGQTWDPWVLEALLDRVIADHNIDESRIYVTGLSMGGCGTWALANLCPERLAAIAPICAPYVWIPGDRFKSLPVWCFHGAMDGGVPVTDSVEMVREIRRAGGAVRFTVYPDADHDSWTETYNNPALYRWFLGHRRKVPGKHKHRTPNTQHRTSK